MIQEVTTCLIAIVGRLSILIQECATLFYQDLGRLSILKLLSAKSERLSIYLAAIRAGWAELAGHPMLVRRGSPANGSVQDRLPETDPSCCLPAEAWVSIQQPTSKAAGTSS